MKVLKVVSIIGGFGALAVVASNHIALAQFGGRDGIVRDALQNGAHEVLCQSNRCQDQTTMEILDHKGELPDGVYLLYPNTPDSSDSVSRTSEAVKSLSDAPVLK
jgi:hypothetical protein